MVGAVLSSGWFPTEASAQSAANAQAVPAAEPVPYWWFHGTIEAGGRFFLNNPQRGGSAYLNQDSLAKYYEYRDMRPGPFGNIWMATGSKDGLYQIDIGGENIGYNDQSYYLDASKAGEHYLSLGWDQSPHLYSTSAQTFYQGVGTSALTRPWGALIYNGGSAGQTGIAPFLYQTDIGIKRDTGSVAYRWTPSDLWDIRGDYSHMARTGTQVDGIVGFGNIAGGGSSPVQVPKPVDDTTQNYGVNGEYAGSSPWGKRFTFKLAYNGSQYTDNFSSYTIQNPYTAPFPAGAGNVTQSPFARMSLWPSNQMNGFSGTLGAELPWQSRYAGTVSYTMMRQDAAFIPMSFQVPTFPLPASSLNGTINTLLSNNIITTQLTSDLTSKLSYRYYDFENDTPEFLFPSWISLDRTNTAGAGAEGAIRSLALSYTKQNFGELLNWRPSREWNLGAEYGFERYTWIRQSADATNENSGKLFIDWKPTTWFTTRSSGYYSNRRYDNYNYPTFLGGVQFPNGTASWLVNPAYRQLMVDNRERWKANVAIDMVALPGLTITPNFKYQDDSYGLSPNQLGLTESRSWNGGVDLTYVFNPRASVMVGYLREHGYQLVNNFNSTSATAQVAQINAMQTNDRIVVDTFTGLIRFAAIPDRLDTELRYTASHGIDSQRLLFANNADPTIGQFPDVTNWFQRLDAVATYKFDKDQVALLGWKGEVKAKLHYAWERNSVSNWQNDSVAPFGNYGEPTLIYLAYNNPNYDVQMISGSLAFIW
jgi:MtrB/PioB family decaheme-associated outer membrane protein